MEQGEVPVKPNKNPLAFLGAGLLEVFFVLVAIIVIFGTLNYFNILSLSTLYPKQLGFLPHQTNTKNNQTGVDLNKPQTYAEKAKSLPKPNFIPSSQQTQLIAIFTGSTKNNLEVETAVGKMILPIDSNTSLEGLKPDSSSAPSKDGGLLSVQNYTFDTFVSKVPKGGVLEIILTAEENSTKTIRVSYLPNYKQ